MNVSKAVIPGMWQLLNDGGHGSAKMIYPSLLTLLTRLVHKVSPEREREGGREGGRERDVTRCVSYAGILI